MLGTENKLTSAMSLTVEGGKELRVTYANRFQVAPATHVYSRDRTSKSGSGEVKSREILSDDSSYNNLENDTYTGDHFMSHAYRNRDRCYLLDCPASVLARDACKSNAVMITAKPISRLLS